MQNDIVLGRLHCIERLIGRPSFSPIFSPISPKSRPTGHRPAPRQAPRPPLEHCRWAEKMLNIKPTTMNAYDMVELRLVGPN